MILSHPPGKVSEGTWDSGSRRKEAINTGHGVMTVAAAAPRPGVLRGSEFCILGGNCLWKVQSGHGRKNMLTEDERLDLFLINTQQVLLFADL